MSRLYQMDVIVKNTGDLNSHEKQDLVSALSKEWPFSFDEFCRDEGDLVPAFVHLYLYGEGEGTLCGGESEEEFATSIAHAAWNAVGKYLPIEVSATLLEQLPCNCYNMEESHYETFLQNKRIEDEKRKV